MLSRRELEKALKHINSLILRLSNKEVEVKRAIQKLARDELRYRCLCREALSKGDELRARMYAYEITGIRGAIEFFKGMEARIVAFKVRLVIQKQIILTYMAIGGDMEEMRKEASQLAKIIPWVKENLEELSGDIDTFLKELQVEPMPISPPQPLNSDLLEKILEEEMKQALETGAEPLPNPPEELKLLEAQPAEQGPLVVSLEEPELSQEELLEERLIDYVKRNGRKLSIRRAAEELGVPEEAVKGALRRLCEKGKITIRGSGLGVRE